MIYIDLGCYDGDTVEQFINWGQLFGDISDSEVYGFDPSPEHKASWQDIAERQSQHVKKMEFIQKAAWVEDGLAEFSLHDIGSTLMQDKNTWDQENTITVKTFDFPKWLRQFKGKQICVKFDIEGSEYPILRKMIEEGTDKLCDLMFIEWHAGKMDSKWRDEEEWIKKNLTCRWLEWR